MEKDVCCISWKSLWVFLSLLVFLIGFCCWSQPALAQEENLDIPEIFAMLDGGDGPEGKFFPPICRPFRKGIYWNGPAAYNPDESSLTSAGITARIISEGDDKSDFTQIIGIGGAPAAMEDLDLNKVRVCMKVVNDDDNDNEYLVKRIIQGPLLTIRGRITEVDTANKTITVNGLKVNLTEHTKIRASFRCHFPSVSLQASDLRKGMPVHVVTQHSNNTYPAVGVLVKIKKSWLHNLTE